jgi:L-2-hydroxycarboxylate dehydrogenase (NAD+)
MNQLVWWDFESVEKFMVDGFVACGVPESDAKICADVLITADKRGIDSHGAGRFKPIYIDRIKAGVLKPKTKVDVIKETDTTAVLDGHNGMGHVISYTANKLALEKALKKGIGIVAVRNSSHYGAACYYPLMSVEKDCFGLTSTNARPSVAPTFGVEAMFGTNPLAWAFPTDEEFPFVMDAATSVTQRGKIEYYSRAGMKLPNGWVIGNDGKYRTDTDAILNDFHTGKAATVPLGGIGEMFGGHKGYGLAMVAEILSAGLSDAQYMKDLIDKDVKGKSKPVSLGHFFMAVEIERFIPIDRFKKITGTMMKNLRNSKTAPDQERIYTPGEKEHEVWLERKEKGVPFNEALQSTFKEVKEKLKLKNELPF